MKSYFNTDIFDNLRKEFGHNFEEFLCLKAGQLEDEYKKWRLARWFSDCFNDAKLNGDIVKQCHVRTSTFDSLVTKSDLSGFIPEEHTKISGRRHQIGKLLGADVFVDDGMIENIIVLYNQKDERKFYTFPFVRDHSILSADV